MNFHIYFIFALLWINSSQGQESCLQQKSCATKCAHNVFKHLLDGKTDLFGSINILTIKDFKYEIPGFQYEVTEATLLPLKNCEPDVSFDGNDYDYTLSCSQLVLKLHVRAKGHLGNLYIDGSDIITIIVDDSILSASGVQAIFVDKEDNLLHIYLTKCYKVNNEVHGKITFQTENNFGISGIQAFVAGRYCINSWKALEEIIRYPVMNVFMSMFMQKKLGAYIRATPMKRICGKIN